MRILFIAGHEFIEKQDNGGRQCSYRNYTMLQRIFGAENVYLCLLSNVTRSDKNKHITVFPTHHNKAEQIKNTLFLRNGYSRKTYRHIVKYINDTRADILFFDFSILGRLLKRVKKCDCEIVLFLHNIEKNYMWNKVKRDGPAYLLPYFSYYYNERTIVDGADKIICLNSRDSDLLQKIYGRAADFLMPMTFNDCYDAEVAEKYKHKKKPGHRHLLFVGSLFAPNYDGLLWFCKNVMPQLSMCRLTIIGKDMEKKRETLSADNIEVIGTVDRLDKYYYEADAVVIPILYGDGMKIKTAEAMMYGKPIFGTHEALEGYEIEGVSGIYECNDASDFVLKINDWTLHDDVIGYAESVRRLFLNKYETETLVAKVSDFLTQI